MKSKLKVHKIKLLGQDYLIKASGSSNMSEIVEYVEKKMKEVIDSGVDSNSQQLRIAIFACLEIAGELFLYKNNRKKALDKIESKSQMMIDFIEEKLEEDNK
jgi:cell division protein ZapA (FtsZ GTPase activity inhibitor)